MMSLLAKLDPDIIAVLVLIIVIAATFLLSRMRLLPQRSMSYVAAAIVGVISFGAYNTWKMKKYMAEYEKAKADAEKTKKELDDLQQQYQLSQQERDRIVAERQARIDALKRDMALSDAQSEERRRAVDAMSDEELDREIEAIRTRRGLQ
jgi:uncharacterized protein HemX